MPMGLWGFVTGVCGAVEGGSMGLLGEGPWGCGAVRGAP